VDIPDEFDACVAEAMEYISTPVGIIELVNDFSTFLNTPPPGEESSTTEGNEPFQGRIFEDISSGDDVTENDKWLNY